MSFKQGDLCPLCKDKVLIMSGEHLTCPKCGILPSEAWLVGFFELQICLNGMKDAAYYRMQRLNEAEEHARTTEKAYNALQLTYNACDDRYKAQRKDLERLIRAADQHADRIQQLTTVLNNTLDLVFSNFGTLDRMGVDGETLYAKVKELKNGN